MTIGDEANGLTLVRSYNSASDGQSDPFNAAVGWTHSFNIYISVQPLPQEPEVLQPPNYYGRCVYNIVGGAAAVGFVFTGSNPPQSTSCGGVRAGTYAPLTPAGSKLELIGDSTNYYRYTGADGSVIAFAPGAAARAVSWTKPDGTRMDFTYSSGTTGTIKSVFSNRGWAILFEGAGKACAVNRAQTYITPTSACPAGAQAVTYTYSPGTYVTSWNLMTSATKAGATRYYQYAANDHVNCIKDPGESLCRIQNTYSNCPEDPHNPYKQPNIHLHDAVTSQTDGAGRRYSYAYSPDSCPQWPWVTDPDYRPFVEVTTTVTESGVPGTTVAVTDSAANLASLTDPLGSKSRFIYDASSTYAYESGDLNQIIYPEANSVYVTKDARGNIISSVTKPKPGSPLVNLTTAAAYPSTCSNIVTCNKPTSVKDARGAVTSFTYDTTHGGVLIESGPADGNGVSPVTRSTYVQRTAWLKNSSGGYAPASSPVWILSATRTCVSTETIGNGCAGGSADEVVTSYDYGPDGGPNNLLLRGMAVTADGQTLRTCYGYDLYGRKISETSPNANLASCP
ncbi:hypothetical protein [Novosphingopyxis sp.]|uniref:hypothetical protein n=1 Tax=Novosphingopyxis sp. TaxID=2709690 RepID=UPI003B5994B9